MTNSFSRYRPYMWGGFAALIALPAVAMMFSTGVNWGPEDFIFATLLFGVLGGGIELAMRARQVASYRWAGVLALGMGFVTLWVNMAVGIIGNDDNPLNAHYLWVLGIPIVGSIAARFKPTGMALAMIATAIAHLAIAGVAHAAGYNIWPFAMVFGFGHGVAAYLYRSAASKG